MANSIFRNALNRVIEARQRQADGYVAGVMLSLDDSSIAALGTTREELRRRAKPSYVF